MIKFIKATSEGKPMLINLGNVLEIVKNSTGCTFVMRDSYQIRVAESFEDVVTMTGSACGGIPMGKDVR